MHLDTFMPDDFMFVNNAMLQAVLKFYHSYHLLVE